MIERPLARLANSSHVESGHEICDSTAKAARPAEAAELLVKVAEAIE
jgi:hypothetical protein